MFSDRARLKDKVFRFWHTLHAGERTGHTLCRHYDTVCVANPAKYIAGNWIS